MHYVLALWTRAFRHTGWRDTRYTCLEEGLRS